MTKLQKQLLAQYKTLVIEFMKTSNQDKDWLYKLTQITTIEKYLFEAKAITKKQKADIIKQSRLEVK
jgi:hypothetical protein